MSNKKNLAAISLNWKLEILRSKFICDIISSGGIKQEYASHITEDYITSFKVRRAELISEYKLECEQLDIIEKEEMKQTQLKRRERYTSNR